MSTTEQTSRQAARQERAAKVRAAIEAAVNCSLCPDVTPEAGLEILLKTFGPGSGLHWWNSTKTIQERADQLVDDPAWRDRALGWIDAYREKHGHGPSWKAFWRESPLWPADTTLTLLRTVTRDLSQNGYLDGIRTPFGLRRGGEHTTASNQ